MRLETSGATRNAATRKERNRLAPFYFFPVRVLLTVKLKAMSYYKLKEHLCSCLFLCRFPFSKVSRHHSLRFRSECSTFHFQEDEFGVSTQNYLLTIA